jgi:hypothetical protein
MPWFLTHSDSSAYAFGQLKSATGRSRCGEVCTHLLDLRRLLRELSKDTLHPFPELADCVFLLLTEPVGP